MNPLPKQPIALRVAILAGGESRRMGTDKLRLRLGRRTILGHARANAKELGVPVRVIERDVVPNCGPVSGVFTALHRRPVEVTLFLSGDMPFVTADLMRRALDKLSAKSLAVFTVTEHGAGFPFALRADALPIVKAQLAGQWRSLQKLAQALGAAHFKATERQAREDLHNINTPKDWEFAKTLWEKRR